MKKQTIILAFILAACMPAWAQREYKITKSAGTLQLNLPTAHIEGYNGNEIIFSRQGTQGQPDERAKGLQALSGSGFADNTGLGISVVEKGAVVEVNFVGNSNRRSESNLHIRVPKQFSLVFNNSSEFADTLRIQDMEGEIEVATSYSNVLLENNTGPMNVKTVYRGVEATFGREVKGPISVVSVYGYVDVALPAAIKANLTLATTYGQLYAAEDFRIARTAKKEETNEEADLKERKIALIDKTIHISPNVAAISGLRDSILTIRVDRPEIFRPRLGEDIDGTINGGGLDLILKSTYRNVYLRTH